MLACYLNMIGKHKTETCLWNMLVKGVYLCETPYCYTSPSVMSVISVHITECDVGVDRAVPYRVLHPHHQSKTDIKFWSFLRNLVEGVGCLHHPPWGWYRAVHPLPESREFDFSKLK